jgi:hypothetical protein
MGSRQEDSVENINLKHDNLDEVTDPVTRAKLAGIQESVYSVDAEIVTAKKGIDEKRGVIAAADLIAKRLLDEMAPIQKAADAETMVVAEAKIRIEMVQKLAEIVRNIANENRRDYTLIQGQVMGLEKAAKAMEARFTGEVGKYERWKRMQSEDAAEKAARTAATEDAQGAAAEAVSKAVSKQPDKNSKKPQAGTQAKVKKPKPS